jgi:hypothetical protein
LLNGGARSGQLDKTFRHSFISTVATDFNIRLTAAGIGFSTFLSPNTGEFWELEKGETFITMLTASRRHFGATISSQNMEVLAEEDDPYYLAFHATAARGGHYTYSFTIRRNSSSEEESAETTDSDSELDTISDEGHSTNMTIELENHESPPPQPPAHRMGTAGSANVDSEVNDVDTEGNENAGNVANRPSFQQCVRPKHGNMIIGLPDSLSTSPSAKPETTQETDVTEKRTKRKKKWKRVGAEEMGFKLTLFPRETVANDSKEDEQKELEIFAKLEWEEEEGMGRVPQQCRPFLDFEGNGLAKEEKLLRRDQDRRVEKAHKQVSFKI